MNGEHSKVESVSTDERNTPWFQQELAKRRREFEYARSKLKEAQEALDLAEHEYGNTQRALQALGYDD